MLSEPSKQKLEWCLPIYPKVNFFWTYHVSFLALTPQGLKFHTTLTTEKWSIVIIVRISLNLHLCYTILGISFLSPHCNSTFKFIAFSSVRFVFVKCLICKKIYLRVTSFAEHRRHLKHFFLYIFHLRNFS